MTEPIIPKNVTDAIDRIARTPEGVALYLYCQRRLMSVSRSADPHTLQSDHGARTFALELIGLMTKGLIESGGRTSANDGGTGDKPIVFAQPEPVAHTVSRGAGRRIGPDTRVPGYDLPDTDR